MTPAVGFPANGYFRRQIALTPKQVGYVGSYSRELLAVEEVRDGLFGEMLLRFTTSILAGRTVTEKQRASVKVPASWWQHLKKTAGEWHTAWLRKPHSPWLLFILPLDILTIVPRVYLIPWFLRRHPVKYAELSTEVRFSREMLYPGADVSLPSRAFGMPVMGETLEIDPLAPDGAPWRLDDYGPPRFLDRREVVGGICCDRDLAAAGRMPYGLDYGTVHSVVEWLGSHGVNVDQLVARSGL